MNCKHCGYPSDVADECDDCLAEIDAEFNEQMQAELEAELAEELNYEPACA